MEDGLYRKVDTKTTFVIRFEYGLQPYKEGMHPKGSGNMKMNGEEVGLRQEQGVNKGLRDQMSTTQKCSPD